MRPNNRPHRRRALTDLTHKQPNNSNNNKISYKNKIKSHKSNIISSSSSTSSTSQNGEDNEDDDLIINKKSDKSHKSHKSDSISLINTPQKQNPPIKTIKNNNQIIIPKTKSGTISSSPSIYSRSISSSPGIIKNHNNIASPHKIKTISLRPFYTINHIEFYKPIPVSQSRCTQFRIINETGNKKLIQIHNKAADGCININPTVISLNRNDSCLINVSCTPVLPIKMQEIIRIEWDLHSIEVHIHAVGYNKKRNNRKYNNRKRSLNTMRNESGDILSNSIKSSLQSSASKSIKRRINSSSIRQSPTIRREKTFTAAPFSSPAPNKAFNKFKFNLNRCTTATPNQFKKRKLISNNEYKEKETEFNNNNSIQNDFAKLGNSVQPMQALFRGYLSQKKLNNNLKQRRFNERKQKYYLNLIKSQLITKRVRNIYVKYSQKSLWLQSFIKSYNQSKKCKILIKKKEDIERIRKLKEIEIENQKKKEKERIFLEQQKILNEFKKKKEKEIELIRQKQIEFEKEIEIKRKKENERIQKSKQIEIEKKKEFEIQQKKEKLRMINEQKRLEIEKKELQNFRKNEEKLILLKKVQFEKELKEKEELNRINREKEFEKIKKKKQIEFEKKLKIQKEKELKILKNQKEKEENQLKLFKLKKNEFYRKKKEEENKIFEEKKKFEIQKKKMEKLLKQKEFEISQKEIKFNKIQKEKEKERFLIEKELEKKRKNEENLIKKKKELFFKKQKEKELEIKLLKEKELERIRLKKEKEEKELKDKIEKEKLQKQIEETLKLQRLEKERKQRAKEEFLGSWLNSMIQSRRYRIYYLKSSYILNKSCIILQNTFKTYFISKKLDFQRKNVILIQSYMKCSFERIKYIKYKQNGNINKLIKLQGIIRGKLYRRDVIRNDNGLVDILNRVNTANNNWNKSLTVSYLLNLSLNNIISSRTLYGVSSSCEQLCHLLKIVPNIHYRIIEQDIITKLFNILRNTNRSPPHLNLVEKILNFLLFFGNLNFDCFKLIFYRNDILEILSERLQIHRLDYKLFKLTTKLLQCGVNGVNLSNSNNIFLINLKNSNIIRKQVHTLKNIMDSKLEIAKRINKPLLKLVANQNNHKYKKKFKNQQQLQECVDGIHKLCDSFI